MVAIQYRTENLRIVQGFGASALDVTPRIGHIHVTVDNAPWHRADGSGEPLIIQSLPPGPHNLLTELVNANHKPFDQKAVRFVIPPKMSPRKPFPAPPAAVQNNHLFPSYPGRMDGARL